MILLVSSPVQAIEINGDVSNNTISWYWNELTVTNVSIDGEYVYGFVPFGTQYQKTFDDKSPTNHILIAYEGNLEIGYNTSQTVGEQTTSDLIPIVSKYIWLIIAVILLIAGKIIRRNELDLLAGLIGFVGLGVVGDELIGKIVYGLLIVVSFYMSFED